MTKPLEPKTQWLDGTRLYYSGTAGYIVGDFLKAHCTNEFCFY